MERYKQRNHKTIQKSKGLRKNLIGKGTCDDKYNYYDFDGGWLYIMVNYVCMYRGAERSNP